MRFKISSALFVAFVLCTAAVGDSPPTMPLPYQTSFSVMDRPPAMPDESIEGWTGWRVPRGSAEINALGGPDSAPALALEPETIVRRPIDAVGLNEAWTEVVVRTAGSPASLEGLPPKPLGAVLLFDDDDGMVALDGDGAGGGTFTVLGLDANPDRWRTIVIRHDFSAQRWDVWVDGLAWGNGFGFRDPVTHLSGFDVGAAESTTRVSHVRVTAEAPRGLNFMIGDVTRNGIVNAGDIVRLVNYLGGGSPLGLSAFINADIDHDTDVDAVDLDLLVNMILGIQP